MIEVMMIFTFGFLISTFFSGVEMAFVSCNKITLKHQAKNHVPAAQIIDELHGKPKRFLAAVLLYTNFGNVSLTAAFVYGVQRQFGAPHQWLEMLVLTPFIIIFAELLPKEYCRQRADELIYKFAWILQWSIRLIAWLVESIISVTDTVIQYFQPVEVKKSPFATRSEIRALIDESARRGVVLDHEKKLIDKILDFERLRVDEMMIPVAGVPKISSKANIQELKVLARKSSRNSFFALVYDGQVSNVTGMIYAFDVLFEQEETQGILPFVRTPLFIRGSVSNADAFLLLQSSRQSLAVVLDKQDRVAGVITVAGLVQF